MQLVRAWWLDWTLRGDGVPTMTATKYDPARAKPETVLAFLEASLTPIAGSNFTDLLFELREQCAIPLRTRAEVDAEIAKLTRECVDDEWAGDDDYDKWAAVVKLCQEPTSDQSYGSSGVDSAGFPPGSRAATGATSCDEPFVVHECDTPEPCSCDEALELRERMKELQLQLKRARLPVQVPRVRWL